MLSRQSFTIDPRQEQAHLGALVGPGFSVEFDTFGRGEWDGLTSAFDDLTYEQTASGMEVKWGSGRLSRLLLRRRGRPVAGAQVVILTLPGIGKGLAYVKFGPFWRRRDEPADPEVYGATIAALVSEYCVRRGHCLTVLPRPTPEYLDLECGALHALGFRHRRAIDDPNRYLVRVGCDEAEQMRSLDQKWRYNLRQALRNGIQCQVSEHVRDLSAFAAHHEEMESRKGLR